MTQMSRIFSSLAFILALLYNIPLALTKLVSVTIDDANGDPVTGAQITYLPVGAWNTGANCPACTAHPDPTQTWDQTWTDGTFNPQPGSNNFPNTPLTASVSFNGSSIQVKCILALTSTSPDGDSDMSFFIDSQPAGTFVQPAPGTTGYLYNQTVFSSTMTPGAHVLNIQNGHVNGTKALILLDSIIYTYDDGLPAGSPSPSSSHSSSTDPLPTPSSSSTPSHTSSSTTRTAVIAAVVAVLVSLFLALLAFCLWRRHQRRQLVFRDTTAAEAFTGGAILGNPSATPLLQGPPPASGTLSSGTSALTYPTQTHASSSAGTSHTRTSSAGYDPYASYHHPSSSSSGPTALLTPPQMPSYGYGVGSKTGRVQMERQQQQLQGLALAGGVVASASSTSLHTRQRTLSTSAGTGAGGGVRVMPVGMEESERGADDEDVPPPAYEPRSSSSNIISAGLSPSGSGTVRENAAPTSSQTNLSTSPVPSGSASVGSIGRRKQ